MAYEIRKFEKRDWPERLSEIPEPPKELWIAGQVPDYTNKFLCVVGTRKYSNYGKEVCEYLIQGLEGFPVTIVSGLALGIDSIAHRAALKHKLPTIAMPGSGLSPQALHPRSHVQLAEEIVDKGGTLISEMEPDQKASLLMHNTAGRSVFFSFPRRNRLMVGISDAILVIEAGLKSGTLITAKFASDYNRDVLSVPGSILSSTSEGSNMLLRIGATPIRSPEDILEALNLNTSSGLTSRLPLHQGKQKIRDYSECSLEERKIIEILQENSLPKDELLQTSGLKPSEFQTAITLLELKGLITEKLGEIHLLQ